MNRAVLGALGPERIRGLNEGRDGIGRGIALEMQFADGVVNTPVARRFGRELLPFADGGVELTFRGEELGAVQNLAAVDAQENLQ